MNGVKLQIEFIKSREKGNNATEIFNVQFTYLDILHTRRRPSVKAWSAL